jgi:CubicO group peptidase (beta-lactamase class C family)
MTKRHALLVSILLSMFASGAHAQQTVKKNGASAKLSPAIQKIDELFSSWSKPDAPGAVLAVVKDGKIIYSRGYGMADIERGAANKPSTVFHIASVSKQFTAFAIHLLAHDGKLSLDDDVRKHLPELHDFGKTITIRHLIHHTSGLRDQWNLLALAGWRLDDVITEDDILNLVWRQKELNFSPGDEYLYCNTGYTLLSLIVKRVSGESFPAFTKRRMFDPLGMRSTHFHDDYGSLVKDRASSYSRESNGSYKYIALSYSNVGATSLFTTVEDLALWDQNFYDARVGGPSLIADMQIKAKLNNGKEIPYASGLQIGEYRGLKTVEHGGGDAGYRTELLRFPDQRFSLIVFANGGHINPGMLSYRAAEIYLESEMTSPPAKTEKAKPVEIQLSSKALDQFVGDYQLAPQFVITVTKENDQLMAQATGQPKVPLFASAEREFFYKVVDAQITFEAPDAEGMASAVVLHQNGRDMPGKRIKRVAMPPEELAKREGEFYSDELHVLYTATQKDGKLVLRYPRGEVTLEKMTGPGFMGAFPIGAVTYTCTATSCDSFLLTNGRVRNLRFAKVQIKPTAEH